MSLDALIMFSGAVVAALPFLGFPHTWQQALIFVFGVLIVVLGVVVRRRLFQKNRTKPLPFNEDAQQ